MKKKKMKFIEIGKLVLITSLLIFIGCQNITIDKENIKVLKNDKHQFLLTIAN